MGAKLCRAGMPPCNADRKAPAAAPGVLNCYGVEFVCDIRSARATGAADEGRSNLRGVFECATARDCSIAQSEAPDAAPGVLNRYELEFVRDIRRARATGAADVGRSNGRGVVDGASAGRRGMVDDAEIGSTRRVGESEAEETAGMLVVLRAQDP